MARTTMASLMAEIAALRAVIENAPAAPVKASTFRTRAQIAAGDGYACTVTPGKCAFIGRTPGRAAIHGIEIGGHAPKAPAKA